MHCLLRQVYSLRKLLKVFATKHTVKAFTKVLIMVERRSGNSLPGCSHTKDNDDERIPWIPNDKVCEWCQLLWRSTSQRRHPHAHSVYLHRISSYDAECELIVMNFPLSFHKLPFTQLLTSFMAGFRGEITKENSKNRHIFRMHPDTAAAATKYLTYRQIFLIKLCTFQ